MPFTEPQPFREALRSRAVKAILPTHLGSDELMALDVALRERSMFAARILNEDFLDRAGRLVTQIIEGSGGSRAEAGLPAMDLPQARAALKDFLASIDWQPAAGDEGTIKDLRTDQRLDLILKTNTDMANGYGQWVQGQDPRVINAWPAQELVRRIDRVEKRNWYERWRAAGGTIYRGKPPGQPLVQGVSEGRCIALKDDPIWEAISVFGQPYPPFDFNSGIRLRDVSRREAIELGVIDERTRVTPQTRPFEAEFPE